MYYVIAVEEDGTRDVIGVGESVAHAMQLAELSFGSVKTTMAHCMQNEGTTLVIEWHAPCNKL